MYYWNRTSSQAAQKDRSNSSWSLKCTTETKAGALSKFLSDVTVVDRWSVLLKLQSDCLPQVRTPVTVVDRWSVLLKHGTTWKSFPACLRNSSWSLKCTTETNAPRRERSWPPSNSSWSLKCTTETPSTAQLRRADSAGYSSWLLKCITETFYGADHESQRQSLQ